MSLAQGAALDDLAQLLYDFLPGTPHPLADPLTSFAGVAEELGLVDCWRGGSKQPAIRYLLGATIEGNRGFTRLILKVVERGITYRKKKNPLTREEVARLNEILVRVGYKIPELHDPSFMDGLPRSGKATQAEAPAAASATELRELADRLLKISELGPQERGYAFERFLSELFALHKLAPRGAFRLVGEQIDGSFQLNNEVYLLEAKWQEAPVGAADLLTFHGKVEGKAHWSRGLFVSYSGFSDDGLQSFVQGRRTSIICMNGLDLSHVLSGQIDFVEAVERKARRAAETNSAFVPVRELFGSVI